MIAQTYLMYSVIGQAFSKQSSVLRHELEAVGVCVRAAHTKNIIESESSHEHIQRRSFPTASSENR